MRWASEVFTVSFVAGEAWQVGALRLGIGTVQGTAWTMAGAPSLDAQGFALRRSCKASVERLEVPQAVHAREREIQKGDARVCAGFEALFWVAWAVDCHIEYSSLILQTLFRGPKMDQPARVFVERRPRLRNAYGRGGFMMISKAGLSELERRLADRSLGMQAVRVLVAMLDSADWENRVEASQKDLALNLGMSLSEVSKASRALLACGLIDRLVNRRGWYKINPRLAWMGSVESLNLALDRERASDRKRVSA